MNVRTFLKVGSLSLLWGPMFLYINLAVKEIPPFTLGASRFILAALILYAILKIQGRSLPKDRATWKHFIISGLTQNALPFTLASWGQQYIDSVLAAVLFATTPLFTMLMARLLHSDETLSYGKIVGATIGFGGVLALFLPGLSSGFQLTLWGMIAIIGSAVSIGLALVYTQKNLLGMPPLVAPTGQIITAVILLTPLSLIVDKPFSLPMPSLTAIGALLLITILSTVVAFILYFRIIEKVTATEISLTTYLNPVIAAILGVIILGETFGPSTFVGSSLIIIGAAVVNGLRIPRLIPNPKPCSYPTAPVAC
jgi:drug/metabolite transporter (DMT)-like permease